jgi:hypothetical protein
MEHGPPWLRRICTIKTGAVLPSHEASSITLDGEVDETALIPSGFDRV